MIKKLTPDDARRSALIHSITMPGEFLPSFGISFLKTIHSELLKLPEVSGFGFFEKEKLQGFIIGTITTSGMMKKIALKSFFRISLPIIITILSKPKTILFLGETLLYGDKKETDVPEILILAILPDSHRRKIGSRLFSKLKQTFRNKNFEKMSVGTLAANTPANAFYKKQKGILASSRTLYQKLWNVYYFLLR